MLSNRIFPSWDQLKSLRTPLMPGELALAQYLDKYLPKDEVWQPVVNGSNCTNLQAYNGWLIFIQPYFNGTRPDIVIFHPKVGMMIYEVKDWNLVHYSSNGNELQVKTAEGKTITIKHPKHQVEHYKKMVLTQLVPEIGELVDQNSANFGLVKTGIYFHHATTDTCRNTVGLSVKPEHHKYFPFIGFDSLMPSKLAEVVPATNSYNNPYWKSEWNEELLFWLIPPFHSLEQGTVLTLKGNQAKIAEPKSGHHRIRGVAGSGKTQALAYRAGQLASLGKNVLIVTYNITLWHYIRDMIRRVPFNFQWSSFTFNHFHGFCSNKLNEYGHPWPKGPDRTMFMDDESYNRALESFFREGIPKEVKFAMIGKESEKYDAVLIDEGQDYYYEWYELLYTKFMTPHDELVVVCDKKQNVYERNLDWLDKRVTRIGLEKFKEPYLDLTTSFRLPPKVAEVSKIFSELFGLNQDIRLNKIERTQNFLEHVVWRNQTSNNRQEDVYNAYRRLNRSGEHPSDIVILLPTHKVGLSCVSYFNKHGIAVNHVFEDEKGHKANKQIFWMGDSRLKMCTVHSFKGWELLNVVLFIPATSEHTITQLDAIIYTAITRTRANLIVINSNPRYEDFGLRLPSKWDNQMFKLT